MPVREVLTESNRTVTNGYIDWRVRCGPTVGAGVAWVSRDCLRETSESDGITSSGNFFIPQRLACNGAREKHRPKV